MVSFSTITKRVLAVVQEARETANLSLRTADGQAIRTSSERVHEIALVTAHEAWSDYMEECFARCLRTAWADDRFYIRPAKDIRLTEPASDQLESFVSGIREGLPRNFGVPSRILLAANVWFDEDNPFKRALTPTRVLFLEAARLLRNDVAHGGKYSQESRNHLANIFQPGDVPNLARRRRPGTILRRSHLQHGQMGTLLEAILDTMTATAHEIETDGNDW